LQLTIFPTQNASPTSHDHKNEIYFQIQIFSPSMSISIFNLQWPLCTLVHLSNINLHSMSLSPFNCAIQLYLSVHILIVTKWIVHIIWLYSPTASLYSVACHYCLNDQFFTHTICLQSRNLFVDCLICKCIMWLICT
jgi:hypothetical protein